MKKVLVPKVRFKGFSEEWKEERFDNIFFNIQEKNKNRYSIKEYISVASNTWKKDVNIKNKQTLWNYSVFRVGDIAYEGHTNEAFPFGRFVINRIGTGIISNIFTVFRPKADLSLDFSQYWVNNNLVMIGLLKRSSKSGIMMNSLTLENVNEEKISLPKYFEQQKIGKLLDQISNLITLEQSKLNKLKQLKQTLLQKMFPDGNSKVPRIRFKGFSKEWKEEKLNDIFKVITGGEPPKNYKNSKHPVGKYKYPIYSNGQEANAIWGFSDNYSINTEAITISSIGTIGFPVVRKMFFTPIIRLKTLLPYNKNMNINFLNLSVSQINFSFNQAGIPSMNSNQLKDNIILISRNFSEQQKIGDFFSKIDSLISLYQSKLNKLKQIKEALLQKMFV
ncbi:restriction endonuclease subunit S [Mycoplasmopsis felis]|uniref:restriction endonuclease subunit S n=2 Tax=Mycoplasmopsis felis TaxID=33923 RepID=UPI002AFE194B|nr:restriction endonuclease subunit S [Mycoplasmopsis felis]WQQ08519.1 restriction endonuclease subunit S [Mycoplasmopsis felis]